MRACTESIFCTRKNSISNPDFSPESQPRGANKNKQIGSGDCFRHLILGLKIHLICIFFNFEMFCFTQLCQNCKMFNKC